jgi:hypothetical protein
MCSCSESSSRVILLTIDRLTQTTTPKTTLRTIQNPRAHRSRRPITYLPFWVFIPVFSQAQEDQDMRYRQVGSLVYSEHHQQRQINREAEQEHGHFNHLKEPPGLQPRRQRLLGDLYQAVHPDRCHRRKLWNSKSEFCIGTAANVV